jgi:predicted AAA+ superfamily ATPase
MKSRLVITYNNPQLEYVRKIKKLKGIKNLNLQNFDKQNIQKLLQKNSQKKKITVVKSDASGVGKSFTIKALAKQEKLNYFYFPISGVIEKFELIHRLKKIGLVKNSLLHLDLNDCDNEFVVRSFLLELLITNCVLHNEFVYKICNEITIYIEIPFGFIDFTSKYPILENFETLLISKNNKAELDIGENYENIQIVANYLLNLKNDSIINNNIYISCLCENNRHGDMCSIIRSVPLRKLQKQEINELINELFNMQEHSFYQINTFINFLAYQFKLFSANFYFGVTLLMNNQMAKGRIDLLSYRKILVQSFLDITKFFTKSAYDELLQMQENTQKFMLQSKNKLNDESEKEILKKLLNQNIISFNKIKFVMIFFNSDEQGISIICKKNDPNYLKLFGLYNACSFGKDVDLVDYEKLSSEEFLEQLQFVLGKNDLVLRDPNGILSLYDLNGYVFTSDNFLKMQLILLRVNSDIPVIMMGETGCGKTSLIKILTDLLNVKLHILNIHAGICDKDIVNFIEKITEIENQFEDEINKNNKEENNYLFTNIESNNNKISFNLKVILINFRSNLIFITFNIKIYRR